LPNATNDGWIKNPITDYIVYGDNALDIELQVAAGNFPPGW
jgi:hypothetical protein